MARSPLTLAAAVTAAVPGAEIVGAGELSAGGSGRFDAVAVSCADGRRLVARVPVDEQAAQDLAAETVALRALSAGVRGLLGMRAPEVIGETLLGDARVLVTDQLPGYQIEAAHLPAGEGAATSLGRAIAAIHALPASVVRSAGLRERSAEESRAEARRVLDRATGSGHVPVRLTIRWREAIDDDTLWRFEPAVCLGGAAVTSFLFEDDERGAPAVTGVLEWHGLSIDDPAHDLRWIASAPEAAADIHAAYVDSAHRAPDSALRVRARLHAELEFARWLVHGMDAHREDVVEDAAGLLESLAEGVKDDAGLVGRFGGDTADGIDDALAAAGRVPERATPAADTSMQTDAYSPADLSLDEERGWSTQSADSEPGSGETAPVDLSTDSALPDGVAPSGSGPASEHDEPGAPGPRAASAQGVPGAAPVPPADQPTAAPDAPATPTPDTAVAPSSEPAETTDPAQSGGALEDEEDPERAARAAFQRWTSSASE